MQVNLVTTWEKKCGIAECSRFLVREFKKMGNQVNIIVNQTGKSPFFYVELAKKAATVDADIIQVQLAFYFGKLNLGFIHYSGVYTPIFYYSLKLFLRLFKRKSIPIVTTIFEYDLERYNVVARTIGYKILSSASKHSDLTIVNTERAVRILGRYGIEGLEIIPIGCIENVEILDKNLAKDMLGLKNKQVITLFGFICKEKGHDIIVRALKDLPDDVYFLVAGNALTKEHIRYEEELRSLVYSLGLKDRVIFFGFASEKDWPVIFSATDVIVAPYRMSSSSTALNVALSFHKCAVTSDIETFRELKNKFDCVITSNPSDLSAKLKTLLETPQKRREYETKAKIFWEKNQWKEVARQQIKLYELLLSRIQDKP